ncbi:Hypothetical protein ORPV_429 [Orpheovirus IHUMI-LCC2]|uniref:Uncharacterized protein n=1 Tax=Orpheovirus IHUMI-LCC2 TaxID=2023057 RepID=A0A2I2L478_9VIRU|nr:Hypothetical protein ORPV_429 [Orpheovirus IHUMI-LCC2]SNW62333.1 Hypothetical protein ORPV_429 [Orpheovirus IHUMI-LCC2]
MMLFIILLFIIIIVIAMLIINSYNSTYAKNIVYAGKDKLKNCKKLHHQLLSNILLYNINNSVRSDNDDIVKSCGCAELQTDHMGRIQHKLYCPIFRELNKDLLLKDFMEYEGFPMKENVDWPKLNI